jgi:hypothetical protein
MRFRPAMLIVVLTLGCQDKKPSGPPAPVESPTPAATIATATTGPAPFAPGPPSLDGTIDGKPFRPQAASIEGWFVVFRQKEGDGESTMQFLLPPQEGANLAGREWNFGGKIDDPVLVLMRPDRKEPTDVFGPDYTMSFRLTKQTRDSVEGVIDLTVKKPAGTFLKGQFLATYLKAPTAPLGPDDAPYVQGKIAVKGAKQTEKLAAGYVGIGTDGKPYSNEAGFPIDIGKELSSHAESPQIPSQVSWLASTESAVTYRHLNVPPGDYLVYVRRDTVMSAWKRVKLKNGDQQTLDLTIDPANTGEVVVTLPESAAKDPADTSLALVPLKADLPELGLGSEHYFNVATVKMGEKTVNVSGIPAGKYRAVRGTDEAEVEVVAGKSVGVTLVKK